MTDVQRRRAFVFLVSLIPAYLLIPHILHSWVNIPYWDDWKTPGRQLWLLSEGKLTLGELFSQHNESRPFFPRLVLISLDWFGWDVRKAMTAIFLMICLASFLLARLAGRLRGMSVPENCVLLLLINAFLFWPNSQIWTFENTFIMVWPPVILLSALLVNLSGFPLRRKVLLNSLLATISTYSWANGMLLWFFALPLPGALFLCRPFRDAQEKKEAWWYLFYAVAGAVNLGFYFHDFERGSLSWDIPRVLDYFFTWLGGFFGNFPQAMLYGRCALAAYVVLAGTYVYGAARRRDFTEGYPWLALGVYAMASGMLTSMGRVKLGPEQAMSPRYTAVSGYLYISLIGLGFLLWRAARACWEPKKTNILRFCAGAVAGLLLPVYINGYQRGLVFMEEVSALRRTVLSSWQWSAVTPGKAGLTLVCCYPHFEDWGAALESHHILRVKRWPAETSANWNFNVTATGNSSGVFDACYIVPGVNRLVVEGWSKSLRRDGPADYVLVTFSEKGGAPRPYAVIPADTRIRSDVAAALKSKKMLRSGFRQDFNTGTLPAGQVTLAAWAVDMKSNTIAPLPNTFTLDVKRD